MTCAPVLHTARFREKEKRGTGRDELAERLARPRVDLRVHAHVHLLHVHHAVARDRGRAGHGEVARFGHEVHVLRHFDALAVGEAQDAVVVHDRVHGLDPQRVDGA